MIRQNELQSAAVQPTLKQPRRSLCYAQACRDRGTHCVGRVHPEPAGNRDVRVTESPDRPGRQQGVDDAIVIAQVIWSLRNSTFGQVVLAGHEDAVDRKSTRLNSSHQIISYAVFCLKKKKKPILQKRSTCARAPSNNPTTDEHSTRTYIAND